MPFLGNMNARSSSDPPDYHEEKNIMKLRKQMLRYRQSAYSHKSPQCNSALDSPATLTPSPRRRDTSTSSSSSGTKKQKTVSTPPWRKKQSVSISMPTRRARSPHPTEISKERSAFHGRQHRASTPCTNRVRSPADRSTCSHVDDHEHVPDVVLQSPASLRYGGRVSCAPIVSPPASPLPPCVNVNLDLDSGESAEQLRRLIGAMHVEFARLRCATDAADARAEKLQVDLISARQEMEAEIIRLSASNEQLRSDAELRDVVLKDVSFRAHRAKDEKILSKARLAKTSKRSLTNHQHHSSELQLSKSKTPIHQTVRRTEKLAKPSHIICSKNIVRQLKRFSTHTAATERCSDFCSSDEQFDPDLVCNELGSECSSITAVDDLTDEEAAYLVFDDCEESVWVSRNKY